MTQKTVQVERWFDVSAQILWQAATDHANMGSWLGVPVSLLAAPKDVSREPGAVRRLGLGPVTVDEEVTFMDAPNRYIYRITRGAPFFRYHQGTVTVEPRAQGAVLRWEVVIDSLIPGVAAAFAAGFTLGIDRGLGRLSERLANA